MDFNDRLYGVTTLIYTIYNSPTTGSQIVNAGSGFFYTDLSEKDNTKEGQWREIKSAWLVTNRHVVLYKDKDDPSQTEYLPTKMQFMVRDIKNDRVIWQPITLDTKEILDRLKLHQNSEVDVAMINVTDILMEYANSKEHLISFYGVTSDNLPNNNPLKINVGDDVLVAGYPKTFYDTTNQYPIIKSGVIASRWGSHFKGQPYFLIDAKLFPGSSGSIVITKPQYIAVIDEKVKYSKDGDFVLLGIYSGYLPVTFTSEDTDPFNVGIVWYSSLITDIMINGVSFNG